MELDGLPSTAMPPPAVISTFWPNHYVRGPDTYVTQFWWNQLKYYEYIVFSLFSGSLSAVNLILNWPLIQKTNQHIYEPKYICDQNWVQFPSLGCEIWCSQGFLLWCWPQLDLLTWLVCPRPWYIHRPILVKLSEMLTKILYSPCFPGHCLLWPWPLIPKANQHYETKYICNQNWVKLPSMVCEIRCRPPNVTLTFGLFT